MSLASDQITIAVTVYDRRRYIEQAISSALNQTVPVKVIVVEDCGPDPELQSFVKSRFGSRIEYYRNPVRRGLFDNWNACLELCRTPLLCILHDDDFLEPRFVEVMLELVGRFPERGLYFGACGSVDEAGRLLDVPGIQLPPGGGEMDLVAAAQTNPVGFPAQLMNVKCAQALGGFRRLSLYAGDWEMWMRLGARFGGACTGRVVAQVRDHTAEGRGTTAIDRKGKRYALVFVQLKRNLALLREAGRAIPFDRRAWLRGSPIPARYLLEHARYYSRRQLEYHWGLFVAGASITWRSRVIKWFCLLSGPRGLHLLSKCRNWLEGKPGKGQDRTLSVGQPKP